MPRSTTIETPGRARGSVRCLLVAALVAMIAAVVTLLGNIRRRSLRPRGRTTERRRILPAPRCGTLLVELLLSDKIRRSSHTSRIPIILVQTRSHSD